MSSYRRRWMDQAKTTGTSPHLRCHHHFSWYDRVLALVFREGAGRRAINRYATTSTTSVQSCERRVSSDSQTETSNRTKHLKNHQSKMHQAAVSVGWSRCIIRVASLPPRRRYCGYPFGLLEKRMVLLEGPLVYVYAYYCPGLCTNGTEIPYHQGNCPSGLFLESSAGDPPMESTATLGIFFGNRVFRSETSGALLFGREEGDVDERRVARMYSGYRPWSTSGTWLQHRIQWVPLYITYIRSIRFAGIFVARYIAKHKHTVGFSVQIQEQRSTLIKTTGHLATSPYSFRVRRTTTCLHIDRSNPTSVRSVSERYGCAYDTIH